jgi:hypothetical protein
MDEPLFHLAVERGERAHRRKPFRSWKTVSLKLAAAVFARAGAYQQRRARSSEPPVGRRAIIAEEVSHGPR